MVYDFDCTGALSGEWAYGKDGFEVAGVLRAVLVPMGEHDKYILNGKYEDISECTHYLVLLMSDEDGEVEEATIQIVPVASDVSTGWDTPLYEFDYTDEDRWDRTLSYMIQDKYE